MGRERLSPECPAGLGAALQGAVGLSPRGDVETWRGMLNPGGMLSPGGILSPGEMLSPRGFQHWGWSTTEGWRQRGGGVWGGEDVWNPGKWMRGMVGRWERSPERCGEPWSGGGTLGAPMARGTGGMQGAGRKPRRGGQGSGTLRVPGSLGGGLRSPGSAVGPGGANLAFPSPPLPRRAAWGGGGGGEGGGAAQHGQG